MEQLSGIHFCRAAHGVRLSIDHIGSAKSDRSRTTKHKTSHKLIASGFDQQIIKVASRGPFMLAFLEEIL